MNIGISNIALKKYAFAEGLAHIASLSLRGIELAPTLLWPGPLLSSKRERGEIKRRCAGFGIAIIGLHSLLFNRPDLQILASPEARADCLRHIERMIKLCADLGGGILSFGAAENRRRGSLNLDEAFSIAVPFFRTLADRAGAEGVYLCIEPLSEKYGCDFITTAGEGARLVQLVGHPNFRMVLDTGSMALNGESAQEIANHRDIILHMHINDPELSFPGAKGVDHSLIADTLRKINYKRWLTLEFLANNSSLKEDIAYAFSCYGNEL